MQGNNRTGNFLGSPPYNGRVAAEGYTFIPPNNATRNVYHPGANAISMNNMIAGNGWEHGPLQGNGNEIPVMIGQWPFINSAAHRPLSFVPYCSIEYSPQGQATASLMTPPSPGNSNPTLLGHRPQPQPQPRSQLPPDNTTQRLPFSGNHFHSAAEAQAHLVKAAWYPSMGNYGIPQTDEQYRFYLFKIYNALRNTQEVWDQGSAAWQYSKFIPGPCGEWTNDKDVESIAHMIIHVAVRVHEVGVKNLAHRRSLDYAPLNNEDVDFTFTQRVHFLTDLLAHSKTAAAEVMSGMNVEKYIAIPVTTLRLFMAFEKRWVGSSPLAKRHWLEVESYNGSGVVHPSPEVQSQLVATAIMRRQTIEATRQMNQEVHTPARAPATPFQPSPALHSDNMGSFGKRPTTGSPDQQDREAKKRVKANKMRAIAPHPADD